jgi:hypothetical protein
LIVTLSTSKFWQWIAECPIDLTVHDTPGRLVATVAKLLKASPDCAILAHAGSGIIHVKYAAETERTSAASTPGDHDEQAVPTPKARAVLTPEARVIQAIAERFNSTNVLSQM